MSYKFGLNDMVKIASDPARDGWSGHKGRVCGLHGSENHPQYLVEVDGPGSESYVYLQEELQPAPRQA